MLRYLRFLLVLAERFFPYHWFFHCKGEFVEQGGKEGDVLMITLSPCGWGARWVNQVKPSVKCMRVELIYYWWPVALHDHPHTPTLTHMRQTINTLTHVHKYKYTPNKKCPQSSLLYMWHLPSALLFSLSARHHISSCHIWALKSAKAAIMSFL